MAKSVYQTSFPGLPEPRRGKVRDIYELPDAILMVASDRLSAFDVVMADPVPDKGKVLNQISLFWFERFRDLVRNHIISADVADFPEAFKPYAEELEGRSVLVKKAEPLAIECVVRGYISGSGWKSYKKDGTVCGIKLPDGLLESSKLPEPIFTPSTKAELGLHDENISFERAAEITGAEIAEKVRDLSLSLYRQGSEYAETKGIIIADTKFEFGIIDGEIILIDEVLTPDSSRFWPRESYAPGRGQDSYDKQYVRDWLESANWDKKPPPPKLPENIIAGTREKYLQALSTLTGKSL